MSTTTLDRREFIASAGAVAVAASLPIALAAEPIVGDVAPRATLADWHIDDMWGVYPRPSEPIGFGRPREDGELVAAAHPADLQFLV